MAIGDPDAKGKSAPGAGRSGKNTGGRRGTQSLSGKSKGPSVKEMKSSNSNKSFKKKKGTTMSKARFDAMTDSMKRRDFGTTSYAKYKEGSVGKTGRRKGMAPR
jgi:hypothetical protein